MKISDEKDPPTLPSAFLPQTTELQSATTLYDEKEQSLRLSVSLPIRCSSQKNINFVTKLVQSLSSHSSFMGSAVLQEKQSKEGRQFRIGYSCLYYLGEGEGEVKSTMEDLLRRCERVHSKIEQLNRKYRVENRVSYWLWVLEREVMSGWVEERVVDRSLKLFDSN